MNRFTKAVATIAHRDFTAILFSRSFLFFLLGPLFPVLVASFAGVIGASVSGAAEPPRLGIAMEPASASRLLAAGETLSNRLDAMPVLKRVDTRPGFDARQEVLHGDGNLGAVLTGTLDAPVLTGSSRYLDEWHGMAALLVAEGRREAPSDYPDIAIREIETSRADQGKRQMRTAQIGQTVMFLLTMLLAGMVMSNLVEEKANKIIEVLAAAVPMDAVFMGKLLAMLGVSFVGIGVWGSFALLALSAGGFSLSFLAAPAVGWPWFIILGVIYFAGAYLLLGSLFLTIGALASTVREVQTLSLPVTMLQVLVFLFVSVSLAYAGTALEYAAIAVPFSSPYVMLARAAIAPEIWPHLLAIAYQAVWVLFIVRTGAWLFRRMVMKSGPVRKGEMWKRRPWQRLRRGPSA